MTSFLRDNIEAFAVAIAMALVIRHYSVEAFRIPTGSMMPTLYGDGVDARSGIRRHGDRILVDKFGWMRGDPRRWQVAVFQYPLNRNTNFIKRIIGVSGEWVAIADGDIWTSDDGKVWRIERKPPGVREQLLLPYWPVPQDNAAGFTRPPPCWSGDDEWALDDDTLSVDASEAGATMRFARRVITYSEVDHAGGSNRAEIGVGDIRFAADISILREGDLEFHIREHGVTHRLVLGPDRSFLEVGGEQPTTKDLDFRVERGDSFCVSFANIDNALILDLDGDEVVLEFDGVPPGLRPDYGNSNRQSGDHGFSILSKGCKARLESARLDRDLHYLRDGRDDDPEQWQVPVGHYFMMGDNTNSSKDSRMWRVAQITLQDGSTIQWEANHPNPSTEAIHDLDPGEDFVIPIDSQGLVRRVRRSEISTWKHSIHWPFVPRDHLIGRAFGIFWPIYVPPLYRGATRIQRIR